MGGLDKINNYTFKRLFLFKCHTVPFCHQEEIDQNFISENYVNQDIYLLLY